MPGGFPCCDHSTSQQTWCKRGTRIFLVERRLLRWLILIPECLTASIQSPEGQEHLGGAYSCNTVFPPLVHKECKKEPSMSQGWENSFVLTSGGQRELKWALWGRMLLPESLPAPFLMACSGILARWSMTTERKGAPQKATSKIQCLHIP